MTHSTLLPIAQAHYDAVNAGDLDAAIAMFADDVVTETPHGVVHGRDPFRAMGEAFLAAAPNQRLTVTRSFESGGTLIVEGVYSGTQTGDLTGGGITIPASGRDFSFSFADFFEITDGTVISHRTYWDNLGLLAQLGALPAPA